MRKKKEEEHENGERWLISYADFITLLFAFFVVMYSVSAINEGKFKAVSEAIRSSFNPIIPMSATNIRITEDQEGTRTQDEAFDIGILLFHRITLAIKEIDETGKIKVDKGSRGVVIRLPDTMVFESGKADILPGFSDSLARIGNLIKDLPNAVQVEGFTDNVPINTPLYPSNWELSTSRAAAIVRRLTTLSISPDRLSVSGYGEFRSIASNDTPEGRAKNRRVEIIILEPKDNKLEPKDNKKEAIPDPQKTAVKTSS